LPALLGPRTRLLAIGAASNVLGTVNDVAAACARARQAGVLSFVDAVHAAPHLLPDVRAIGCDFLACSAYKFFGPHVGILWGKRALLAQLPAYKLRPVPESLPDRWQTGTQNHEGWAGVAAAVEYLAGIGADCPLHHADFPQLAGRRLQIHAGMAAIASYEASLAARLLGGLGQRPRVKVWGIVDPRQIR